MNGESPLKKYGVWLLLAGAILFIYLRYKDDLIIARPAPQPLFVEEINTKVLQEDWLQKLESLPSIPLPEEMGKPDPFSPPLIITSPQEQ